MIKSKQVGFWLGILFLLLSLLLPSPEGMSPEALKALGVACLMATWWISECIPIYATAFVPIVIFLLCCPLAPAPMP